MHGADSSKMQWTNLSLLEITVVLETIYDIHHV